MLSTSPYLSIHDQQWELHLWGVLKWVRGTGEFVEKLCKGLWGFVSGFGLPDTDNVLFVFQAEVITG